IRFAASDRARFCQAPARSRRSGGAGPPRSRRERIPMTDREAFLARWSRRKREAAAPPAEPVREESAAPTPAEGETSEPAREPAPAPQPAPELPPIDTIDAATDIRGFLEAGVPQDLARAALRRAWSSDPAIRDFIGLSENSWDFTAPDGVPGFGPFAPDAAQQLVAQVLGNPQ